MLTSQVLTSLTFDLNVPPATVDGEFMLGAWTCLGDAAGPTIPAGWNTLVANRSTPGSDNWLWVGWRIAASEPASYQFAFGTARNWGGGIASWPGVDPLQPFSAVGGELNVQANVTDRVGTPVARWLQYENDATPDWLSVHSHFPNSRIVGIQGSFQDNPTAVVPAGTTERWNLPVSTNPHSMLWDQTQVAAGDTGPYAGSGFDAAGDGQTLILALKADDETVGDQVVTPRDARCTEQILSTTSFVADVPSLVQAGDRMVAVVAVGIPNVTNPFTPPAGWVEEYNVEDTSPASENHLGIYSRVASGSEPVSYTWTVPDSTSGSTAMIVYNAVSGMAATALGNFYEDQTTATHPSVTTLADDELLVGVASFAFAPTAITPPGSANRRIGTLANTQFGLMLWDEQVPVAGLTGTRVSGTFSASSDGQAVHLGIAGSGGAPTGGQVVHSAQVTSGGRERLGITPRRGQPRQPSRRNR